VFYDHVVSYWKVFGELLSRHDGANEMRILHFFNDSSDEDGTSTLLFYAHMVEEEHSIEVECGNVIRLICLVDL